ncbi:Oidioi.mRNA.OKI2018_I69.chr1.g64.t1.cds [Oikopleura dioica]|uniref:Oidioi.mRNA.OKI2018_I69.chr1.g64.t1.cds n=1 Tax=Oikopleura dioica TaxID=34765 RepID=A0ABN7SIQ1_OIKDI|nr:Oidioi.mRNA.OKI2018_I69.chr1.g64.t1.cds [Oikopleura dioica]
MTSSTVESTVSPSNKPTTSSQEEETIAPTLKPSDLNSYLITSKDLVYDSTDIDFNIRLQDQFEKTACINFIDCHVTFPCDYSESNCGSRKNQDDLIQIQVRTEKETEREVEEVLNQNFEAAQKDPSIPSDIKDKLKLEEVTVIDEKNTVAPTVSVTTTASKKCVNSFVESTTGIVTITVVSVLSAFYIIAACVFIFKYWTLSKTIIITSSIIIFELVMVLVFFTVLGAECPDDGISPALGGGLIGASIFVWLAITIGMYIFQNRRKVSEKNVSFSISDVTSDDSTSMNRYANPFDD